jgi:DNA repair protein RecN (Recombination protein N)
MLKSITINNYALIDELNINLDSGLTIITGETGAGKSILLGALALVLGDRADSSALQEKTKKCVVEGVFDLSKQKLKSFFADNDLDYETLCTIRREISAEGKSRAFINDTPVTLQVLKTLGESLIDVHSQHQTLILNKANFQLAVVDAFAEHVKDVDAYTTDYAAYKKRSEQLIVLENEEAQSKKDVDYFQFQFTELEQADLDAIDLPAMESELQTLMNAEDIKANLLRITNSLTGGDVNLLSSLSEVKQVLTQLAKFNKEIAALSERTNASLIELKDIAREIESVEEDVVYNPKRMEELSAKTDELNRLLLKHRVQNTADLIAIRNTLADKLQGISSLDIQIEKLKKEMALAEKNLFSKAQKLSKARQAAMPQIEKEISKTLTQLGMPNAQLIVKSDVTDKLTATGIDSVGFLFSANKGSNAKELNKVASGGELSRLMLSIKALVAKLTQLPSIIFDEIDTGVSGDVANKVGEIMSKMGVSMQVIAITHLPQIAGKGAAHLFVFKEIKNGKTFTRIKELNKEERIYEIARMLSTDKPTDAAIKNAKELLKV